MGPKKFRSNGYGTTISLPSIRIFLESPSLIVLFQAVREEAVMTSAGYGMSHEMGIPPDRRQKVHEAAP